MRRPFAIPQRLHTVDLDAYKNDKFAKKAKEEMLKENKKLVYDMARECADTGRPRALHGARARRRGRVWEGDDGDQDRHAEGLRDEGDP